MILPKINSLGLKICFNRLISSHLLDHKSFNCETLCKFSRHFSSNVTADISVVSDQQASISGHNQSLVLSQSDIVNPENFQIEPLDLTNTNQSLTPVRQAWVENMSTPNSIKLGMIALHPSIFSVFPRPDMIQENHKWQTLYKHIDWRCMKTRSELKGSGKKPWPQKGTGRARHGSRKSPQWVNGGWAVGPRGPKTFFYMLPWHKRVNGLISMLASKFSQNDLFVVDSFETFPTDGTSAHLEELCEERGWGPSVLFVDHLQDYDAKPAAHFYNATQDIKHINVLPVYGLNVFSMLKHETLVFTVDAIRDVQKKLLFQQNRVDLKNVVYQYKPDGVYRL